MDVLAFDRARLELLRIALGAALDDMHVIRCDDTAAMEAMRSIRAVCRTLTDECLPRVQNVLDSDVMTSYRRSALEGTAAATSAFSTLGDRSWEMTPGPFIGPPWTPPGSRSYAEVIADIRSGAMVPMATPLDAQGRAGAHYTSLTFAAGLPLEVGTEDLTSNLAKFVDFVSEGLPIGWHEHQEMSIYYLSNARVTSAVHVLNAYDRDEGPETLIDLTTEATVSGYMVIRSESGTAELNLQIGPGIQDPTQNFVVITATSSGFSGMFFPDEPPDFEPVPPGDRYVNKDTWTFTRSASPMVDEWGTWKL